MLESIKPFIGTKQAIHGKVAILGFPFDGTTSFRPGARFGPEAIRSASYALETYSPYLDKDIENLNIIDLGDLEMLPSQFLKMKIQFDQIIQQSSKVLTLGGEHSISYCPMSYYLKKYSDLIILHLDAHTDLRDGYLEDPYSHASVIYRTQEEFTQNHRLIQYGIRSGTKKEFTWMKENRTFYENLDDLLNFLSAIDKPIYMTLDLDFFDPSILPGTGTPEAGGENFHNFMRILKILNQKNFIGADIVELSPQIDTSGNSSIFAAKIVRETLLALS